MENNNSDALKMISALNGTMSKFMLTMETNMTMMLQCMNSLIQLQVKIQK